MLFYRKYRLYDEGIEIMIPSDIEPADSFVPSQNSWMSKDKKTVINVSRGGEDLTETNLNNRKTYGEIQYLSHVTGYCFYNIFLLGSYMERELVVTIQCMESSREENEHIFENISDSIRVLRRQGEDTEGDRHAGKS